MLIEEKQVEDFIKKLKGRINYEAEKPLSWDFPNLINMCVISSQKSLRKLRLNLNV